MLPEPAIPLGGGSRTRLRHVPTSRSYQRYEQAPINLVSSSAVSKGSVTWTHDGPIMNWEAIPERRQIPLTPLQEATDNGNRESLIWRTWKQPWASLNQLVLVDKATRQAKFWLIKYT